MLPGHASRRLLLNCLGGEEALVAEAARRLGEPNPDFYITTSEESNRGIRRPLAVSFLFHPGGPLRRRRLQACIDALVPGGRLIVLDYHQPRTPWLRIRARAWAVASLPWIGAPPFERLRHPVAGELREAGLDVLRIRLLAGELVQAVLACRPRDATAPASVRSSGAPSRDERSRE